jgi:hypothetical protein
MRGQALLLFSLRHCRAFFMPSLKVPLFSPVSIAYNLGVIYLFVLWLRH